VVEVGKRQGKQMKRRKVVVITYEGNRE